MADIKKLEEEIKSLRVRIGGYLLRKETDDLKKIITLSVEIDVLLQEIDRINNENDI